jgi:ABC-type dipeptide/oligopeptide/nickel transport system ATPase subunit
VKSFGISIHSIQHIKSFELEVDLTSPGLMCLVGRNGVGKTTLIRALRNLSNADTFVKTANPQIFDENSRIEYRIDGFKIDFNYDPEILSLNCKQVIPQIIRDSVLAELPIPYGDRFNYFRSASDADSEIRKSLIISKGRRPEELIEFLSSMYSTDKYNNLIEVSARGRVFYNIALPDGRYIREDYLSSGEYFLINLYRTIKSGTRLIAIDEIELSLDAAAQSQLMQWLREFCRKYGCTILFTTHSLAIMRTLDRSELSYIELIEGQANYYPASYSYIKARLFGFQGWDKYILTEDGVLKDFIEYIIQNHCSGTFFTYKVIHIGGAVQVTDLLRRNEGERFLASPENVIAILDGDQREVAHAKHDSVYFIPVESVEKAVYLHYSDDDFPFRLPQAKEFTGPKDAFNSIKQQKVATTNDLHEYLCRRYAGAVTEFAQILGIFLGCASTRRAESV